MSGGVAVNPRVGFPSVRDWVALAKPGITTFALITCAGGLLLAPGTATLETALLTLFGTGLLVAAANTLNMYLERDSDCLMARTRHRPLPGGRMAPSWALAYGVALALVAVPLLTFTVNALTGLLGVIAFLTYLFLYTPLKRRTTFATLIGSLPGAMPVLMGYAAQTGRLDLGGLVVFGVLFVWQVPHFHAISLYRREDYRRAGLKILPVEGGLPMTLYAILFYLALQIQLSLLVFSFGVAGRWYAIIAVILNLVYFGYAVRGIKDASPRWARQLFLYSLIYLPILFLAMVIDGIH